MVFEVTPNYDSQGEHAQRAVIVDAVAEQPEVPILRSVALMPSSTTEALDTKGSHVLDFRTTTLAAAVRTAAAVASAHVDVYQAMIGRS